MTSSLRKVVCVFRIKFHTKRIFRIFPILRTDGMAPFGTYLWNDPRIYQLVSDQHCTSMRPREHTKIVVLLITINTLQTSHSHDDI